MNEPLFEFGQVLAPETSQFTLPAARRMLLACQGSPSFEIINLRRLTTAEGESEVIEVDCLNDMVPSRNKVGIRNRERLALVFHKSLPGAPDVRALRRAFPVTPHQNAVPEGEPASLCLFSQPWFEVERTWTPQIHLRRILWWLAAASTGALHNEDQPLESLFFSSPFQVVLPLDFEKKVVDQTMAFTLHPVKLTGESIRIVRGAFRNRRELGRANTVQFLPIILTLDEVVHGPIERPPRCLGDLHDRLSLRGAPLHEKLYKAICELVSTAGPVLKGDKALLILCVPLSRTPSGRVERYHFGAFILGCDFAELGERMGALNQNPIDNKYYSVPILGRVWESYSDWRALQLSPLDVVSSVTEQMGRLYSGINDEGADFRGTLAGVGALGSSLADIWSRESWGHWTLIDNDHVAPHNTVRHIAKDLHIGHRKVDVVGLLIKQNHADGYVGPRTIADSATNISNIQVREAIQSTDLVVDASTTLELPRDLDQNSDAARSASLFMVPSGNAAVLLLEDESRLARLATLEMQYYRAILNNDWGETHLRRSDTQVRTGTGCRDVSVVMSVEAIYLFAGILSRQLRLLRDRAEPSIWVWMSDPISGGVRAVEVEASRTCSSESNAWRVRWDVELEGKLRSARSEMLPSETGGILLGIVDQKSRTIFIVDALLAPEDSIQEATGFVRGAKDVLAQIEECSRRTAGMVGYIGEWHSHPPFHSSRPSCLDRSLLGHLASLMTLDGQPALILIVGEDDIRVAVDDANCVT